MDRTRIMGKIQATIGTIKTEKARCPTPAVPAGTPTIVTALTAVMEVFLSQL